MTHAYTIWITVFYDALLRVQLKTKELSEDCYEMRQTTSLYDSNQWILILKIHNTSDIFIFLVQKYKQYWI